MQFCIAQYLIVCYLFDVHTSGGKARIDIILSF
jgi:hypothetical protein